MTTSVSAPLSAEEDTFKSLIWDPIIAAGKAELYLIAPILNAPILGTIDNEVIKLASDWIFGQIRMFIDIDTIQLTNAQHQAAYESASVRLKVLAIDHGIASPQYQEALNAAKLALSAFTRMSQ